MELKNKLKQLRSLHNMTQEAVAENLGVSAQTVSKWERGLLSPDISLLPKIAMLFKCSIDSLFDMELVWSAEHRQEFEAEIHSLHNQKDFEGMYQAWIREIKLNPDTYRNYKEVMFHVLRHKMFDKERIEKLISLADHAEKCCTNDDTRNEICRIMLQICCQSDDAGINAKGRYYYQKLPQLRHSREVYAKFVLENEEYREQILKNIIYLIDLAECSVRQLILPDMPLEEKLFYYQKAAELYETVLDNKYAGFYDPPLLSNYYEIARIYIKLGQQDMAKMYVERIFEALDKHFTSPKKSEKSRLLYSTTQPNPTLTIPMLKTLLKNMMDAPELQQFKDNVLKMKERFDNYTV